MIAYLFLIQSGEIIEQPKRWRSTEASNSIPRGEIFIMLCVCVYANPLHLMCFGFRAMPIDGVHVVYFRSTQLLGRPRYVDDVYLYCVLKASEF